MFKLRSYFEQNFTGTNGLMPWAVAATCFFGFMRSGEVTLASESAFDPNTHLSFKDVSVNCIDNPRIVKLNLKASKFRKGIEVVLGRTNNILCPVPAVSAYLSARGDGPGFLFLFSDSRPLTKHRFIYSVHEALSAGGVDPSRYAGH